MFTLNHFQGENKENQNEESKSNSELPDSVKVIVHETSSVPDQDTVDSKDLDFSEIDFDGLTADQKEQAIKMLREESDPFAKSDDDIGAAPDLTHDIKLSDQTPVQKSYLSYPRPLHRGSFKLKLHCKIIDYRGLNAKTIPDRHPIPRVQETLHNLGGNSWFSVLDQGKAYYQGFLTERSQPLTAFITQA